MSASPPLNPTTVEFTLTASQIAARTVRVGITVAYAGGPPQLTPSFDH